MGNLNSVKKAFKRVGANAVITNDPDHLNRADKLVLPGVGHFKAGIDHLKNLGLVDILSEQVLEEKKPILGICLGMQLFTEFSEESGMSGLGWIKAKTYKFNKEDLSDRMKVPHMGWNSLINYEPLGLLSGIGESSLFYFVHSFYIKNDQSEDIISETNYGVRFTSAFNNENIYGVQFHPEKSHDSGLKLLQNFVRVI